ncbi:MAG TPA: hypothetical protein VL495_08895 [Edaphobacter sp.]|nr:hypothetical protein [Edaphobacter sp.]
MPRSLVFALVLIFVTKCGLAKGPDPAQVIQLIPLGFQPLSTQFMLAGSSMETIDYLDARHLLVTFSAKRLLKRMSDCPPSDQDRVVDALLLELPSGKVLAKTSWRTHDHGQYLWNLGRGRFMLRIRDDLSTFAPLVNLGKGNAFKEQGFIRSDRRIGGILLSPNEDLMILETLDKPQPEVEGAPKLQEMPVQINFFRLIDMGGDQIDAHPGGALLSRVPGKIPANSVGYISILDEGRQRWGFNFTTYGGKVKELAGFDSTCRPSPMLVSSSEFIAFGCHQSHTPQVVGAFNMRGEEMWQQNMTENYVAPSFAYAPGSGRFAFSRVVTRSSIVDTDSVTPEMFDGQSIVVYQIDSGRQLLRVDAEPIARAGQNFALSPDGMSLSVIRNDTVEVYTLPGLTPDDRKAIQLAQASAPQMDGDPSLALAAGQGSVTPMQQTVRPAPPPVPQPAAAANPAPVAPTPDQSNSSSSSSAGSGPETPASSATKEEPAKATAAEQPMQPEGEQPRKPPTLYAPGESREGNSPNRENPKEK